MITPALELFEPLTTTAHLCADVHTVSSWTLDQSVGNNHKIDVVSEGRLETDLPPMEMEHEGIGAVSNCSSEGKPHFSIN